MVTVSLKIPCAEQRPELYDLCSEATALRRYTNLIIIIVIIIIICCVAKNSTIILLAV